MNVNEFLDKYSKKSIIFNRISISIVLISIVGLVVYSRKLSRSLDSKIAIFEANLYKKAKLADSIEHINLELKQVDSIAAIYLKYSNTFNPAVVSLFSDSVKSFFLLNNIDSNRVLIEFEAQRKRAPESRLEYDPSASFLKKNRDNSFQFVLPSRYYKDKVTAPQEIIMFIKFNDKKKIFFVRAYYNKEKILERLLDN
jgi:hypothetical protein